MKKLNEINWKSFLIPHLLVVLGFAMISLLFYYPLLSGNTLVQSDIRQYEGMARQLKEYRAETGKETYWVDNAFGGMPSYQLGAEFPADVLRPVYNFFRLLPRPAHILFLYFLGVYLLLVVFRVQWQYAVFGALSFGFSTYLLIILQVGHNTKALAVSFFSFSLAGLLLLIRNRFLWGFVLSTLAMAMQIRANHYQMTYYLLFLLAIFIVGYGIQALRESSLPSFFKSIAFFGLSGILAIGLNATPLLATAEYSKFSTRSASELKLQPDGSPKEQSSGLDYDYITEYSYGIFESLNLIVPRIQGGGSSEDLGEEHGIFDFLVENGVSRSQATQFVKNVPTYWGDQPILEAPAYIGITVFFFALLGVFFVKSSLRNVLLAGILFSLILSWGKNLPFVTSFFIDFVPFYNKFRAVSSVQVLLELCFPLLAVLGLNRVFSTSDEWNNKRFLKVALSPVVFFLALLLLQNTFSFAGGNDTYFEQIYGPTLLEKIREARASIFKADLIRAILYVLILTGIIWAYRTSKAKKQLVLIVVFAAMLFDLLGISKRYIDFGGFVKINQYSPFEMTAADQTLIQDTTRYRVLEPQLGLTGARTAYFHNAIGGYHGAKPRRFEELHDYYRTHQLTGVLDFLNVKYVLYSDPEKGILQPMRNPNSLGAAWPIHELKEVESADALLQELNATDFKTQALIISNDLPETIPKRFTKDSLVQITLEFAQPDYLKYKVQQSANQFYVFSEMYYPQGWTALIDGVSAPIYNVNYVLRGLYVPNQAKTIEFLFQPPVVKLGTQIRWFSFILFLGISGVIMYLQFRKPIS